MSHRRWRLVAEHELRSHLSGPLFWVLLVVVATAVSTLNPVAMIRGDKDAVDGVRAAANSMHALAPTFAMSAFFCFPFFVALMAGLAVLRDDEAGIGDLLHSTPLTAREYIWGKFAGAAAAGGMALLAQLLVIIVFREIAIGGVARGPFSLLNYLVPLVMFALPTMLSVMGIAFMVGTRTRQPMAVYAIPVALLTLNFFLFWNWRPDDIAPWLDRLLMIVDPTGLRWLSHSLFSVDKGFSYYNSTPIRFDATIVIGRLATIIIPLFLVEWSARDFGRQVRGQERKRAAGARSAPPSSARFGSIRELIATPHTPGVLRGTGVILEAELRELSRRPSLYLFLIFLMAVVHEAGAVDPDAYGAQPIITAGWFATTTMPVVTLLVSFFLLFQVVEVLHRDQVTRFDAIGHAMPVPTGAMLAGRGLAIGAMILAIVAVCVTTGVIAQQGGPAGLEILPLLLVYGGVMLPTFLLWSSFVAAALTLTRSRNAALAAGFAALLLTGAAFLSGSLTWVTNWPLWLSLPWSDFGIFPMNGEALWLNRSLALLVAFSLMIATRLTYRRIEPDGARQRASRGRRIAISTLRLAPTLVLGAIVASFLSIRLDSNEPPLPLVAQTNGTLQHADLDIALDPPAHRMAVKGSYLLRQASSDTIRQHFDYTMSYPAGYNRNGGGAESFILPEGVSLSTHRGSFLPVFAGDRFTADVIISAPSAYQIAFSGDRINEADDGTVRTSRWRTDAPVTALSLHAGLWETTSAGNLSVALHPSHRAYAPRMMGALAASVSTYTEWFGPLAWNSLRLSETPAIAREATSYPGSIVMSESLVLQDSGATGSMQFDVVAHEVAHQWWGHTVIAAEGPGTGWLVEGLADYSMLALIEDRFGADRALATVRRLEREYLEGRNATRERSLLESEESVAGDQAVLQKRGALVLWMLRRQFGRERVQAGLRKFAKNAGKERPAAPQELLASLRAEMSDTVRFDAFVTNWISGTTPLEMD